MADMVNEVGCYLDVLNSIRQMVPPVAVEMFDQEVLKRKKKKKRRVFLKEETAYGKGGWEAPFETKWNVDLFMDMGAIEHGVRAI